jgi:hypothetical protein
VLARPLPLVSRAATIALIVLALVGGASAASADSLPDDPLYGLKLNAEQMRLSLAQTDADRAAVELVIAETRLRETTALVAQSRDAEADAAASAYGEYVAVAAARLAESAPPDLVDQLRARVARQRTQLLAPAAADTPSAVAVLASMTQQIAAEPDADGSSIADAAARAAEQAATMARSAAEAAATKVSVPATARPAATAEQRAKLQAAAKAAQNAAQRARAAAERAKKAAEKKAKSRVKSVDDAESGESGH